MTASGSLTVELRIQATAAQLELLDTTIALARKAGTTIYLVGGAVRDLLRGEFSGDLDLVVEGDAIELAREIASRAEKDWDVHERFATATVHNDSFDLDLASARREVYPQPGALPNVEPSTLAEDLERRDFTVNAMALALWPERSPELIDPFCGRKDLRDGRLVPIHDRSFLDDPTRILRGVRLESKSDLRFAAHSESLIRQAVEGGVFEQVSGERLQKELSATFGACQEPRRLVDRLAQLGVLQAISPLWRIDRVDWAWFERFSFSAEELSRQSRIDPGICWHAVLLVLLDPLGVDARHQVLERLSIRGHTAKRIALGLDETVKIEVVLADAAMPAHRAVEVIESAGPEARILLAGSRDTPVRQWIERYVEDLGFVELVIGGEDLLAAGFEPGPQVGKALTATLRARLDGTIGADDELEYALDFLSSQLESD